MSKKPSSDFNEQEIETILAEDIDCKGKLKFNKSILIKGRYEGEIDTEDGQLYIGPDAELISNSLKAGIISNKGKIFGNIKAMDRIEQYKGSYIEGDIVTPDLYVESGSIFNGHCTMIKPNK